jgi:hypothetical protein
LGGKKKKSAFAGCFYQSKYCSAIVSTLSIMGLKIFFLILLKNPFSTKLILTANPEHRRPTYW